MYLSESKVTSKDDWSACGFDGHLTFGFMDDSIVTFDLGEGDDEDLMSEVPAPVKVSTALTFASKEEWEYFKEVGDWVFSCFEED